MDKKNNNSEQYTAVVEDPTSGEKVEFIGVSEEDLDAQMTDFFDYGLDSDGVYVGEEAD